MPSGEQALTGDASLARYFPIWGGRDVAQGREVVRALAAFVFTEGLIEDRLQRVLNALMPAYDMGELFGIGGKTRDRVRVACGGVYADDVLCFHHTDARQSREPVPALKPAQLPHRLDYVSALLSRFSTLLLRQEALR